jgi:FkbM family methyltransferase
LRLVFTSYFIQQRGTKHGALINLKKSGFSPACVIDVGAQVGTPELYNVFPNSKHLFIEPVSECIDELNRIAASLPDAKVFNCAVGNEDVSAILSMSDTKQYSSIVSSLGGESRIVDVKKVDSIFKQERVDGSILLKIDVDGAEENVLQGSQEVLSNDCVVVIEATLADSSPRFGRIVDFMESHGYQA